MLAEFSNFEVAIDKLKKGGAMLCAALALGSCSAEVTALPTPTTAAVARCFDGLMADPKPPVVPPTPEAGDPNLRQKLNNWLAANRDHDAVFDPPPITLHLGPDGHLAEEELPSQAVLDDLEDANLLLSDGTIRGSGFLTVAPDGSIVLISVGHMARDLEHLVVTNRRGETARVIGGCVVYESGSGFVPVPKGAESSSAVRHDIAILRLSKSLGSKVLPLAEVYPPHGSWVTFVNNQNGTSPTRPSVYSGVVATVSPNWHGSTAVTGVQPWRGIGADGENAYTILPGASGALVANSKGEIVGVSYAGPPGYSSADSLRQFCGISFDAPIGHQTGLVPIMADIMDVRMIRAALQSAHY